jgi:fatty acid desaturase
VILAEGLGGEFARFITPERGRAIEAVAPVAVRAGIVYALAALAFVVAGTRTAPRYRLIVSVLLYAAGGLLAWWGLKDWYIPEGYPRAYQRSLTPLAFSLLGGVAGVLLVLGKNLRANRRDGFSTSRLTRS